MPKKRTDFYDIWHVLRVLTRLILVTVRVNLVANEMWKNILGKSWRRLVHEKGEGDTSKKEIVIPFLTVG